jgi:hypothetical protein
MSAIKEYYHEYLSAEEFDYMFDDEYEQYLIRNNNKLLINNETYGINDGDNSNDRNDD